MTYPPPTLATNRTNATAQQDVHAADHNAANLAVNDIVGELGTNPSGTYATVDQRISASWNSAWGYLSTASQAADFGTGAVGGEQAMLVSTAAPFVDGRRIRIRFTATASCTVPGEYYIFLIRAGSGIAGASVRSARIQAPAGAGYEFTVHFEGDTVMTGGTTQWTFTANRTSGTGTLKFFGTSGFSNSLTVYDIGPVTRL